MSRSRYKTVVEYTVRWVTPNGGTKATERRRRWKDACRAMMMLLEAGAFQDGHKLTLEFGNKRILNK